jgi:hypothetical protein
MFEGFPVLTLARISADENGQTLAGSLSSTMHERHPWINDRWVGFLVDSERFIYGRWYKKDDEWVFRPERSAEDLVEGRVYIAIDGHWGERIELMFPPFFWSEANFGSEGSHSHDHCFYCWKTISEHENKQHMKSSRGESACNSCFREYVQARCLDFICYPDSDRKTD